MVDFPAPPDGRTGWPWTADRGRPTRSPSREGSEPLVSVVTPSFNQGEFIEAAIRSVLLQEYPAIEYIVVDGGSTDASVEVIRKYEPWLALWKSESDDGQSQAINYGLRHATGEILCWLNSDDMLRPDAIQRVVEAFRRHPEAGMIYGRSEICDEDGRTTGKVGGRPFDLEELIWGRCPVAQPSAFFRKPALDRVGRLDEALHFAMDVDLWIRLGMAVPIVFVDEIWSKFRVYPRSKTGTGRLPFLEEIHRVLERRFDSEELPERLRVQRRVALARSHARLALENHRWGRVAPSRRQALNAIKQNARILKERRWRRRLLGCLVGIPAKSPISR